MDNKTKKDIIENLKKAISSHEKGLALFENKNYEQIPKEKEKEILAYCENCSRFFKLLREDLDILYTPVYETFRQGGIETNCRIEFAKSRLKDLGQ